MLTGRRYLLALTPEQAAYAEQVGAACRAVWNVGLEQRREYRRRGGRIGFFEQSRQLTEAKADPLCAWLNEAPAVVLHQALRDLDVACRHHGALGVRWRSKARSAPTFRFPQPDKIAVRRLTRRWGEVKLPKFGWVRFRWTRALGGTLRNATVVRDGGRWYVSFCIEDGVAEVEPNGRPPVGVDRGVVVAAATSDGELLDRALVSAGEAGRLRRLHQQLARHARRSNRRRNTRAKLTALYARVRHRRIDFNAQVAVRLVREHGLVAVEDLRIASMVRSAAGTVENPGRNVRAKAGLNRSILSKGWGGLVLQLEHAARYHGAIVVKVNPAHTSQTCHACKHVDPKSRESQAVFRCTACGHQDHADVNAAKNIRERGIELAPAAGHAVAGRGDLGIGRSVKRQPPVRETVRGRAAEANDPERGGRQLSRGDGQLGRPHPQQKESTE